MVSFTVRLLLMHLLCMVAVSAQSSWAPKTEKVVQRLLENLEERQRRELAVSAVVYDSSPLPYPRPGTNAVLLSPAFTTLVERLSLAVARDAHRSGYFDDYIALCAKAENGIADLPDWNGTGTDAARVDNEHVTAFYQIVSTVVGAELFHHILGQYDKARKQKRAPSDSPVSIKTILNERDVRKAFREGLHIAHQCGYSPDAAQKLVAACGRSATKPSWYQWFFPPKPIEELAPKT